MSDSGHSRRYFETNGGGYDSDDDDADNSRRDAEDLADSEVDFHGGSERRGRRDIRSDGYYADQSDIGTSVGQSCSGGVSYNQRGSSSNISERFFRDLSHVNHTDSTTSRSSRLPARQQQEYRHANERLGEGYGHLIENVAQVAGPNPSSTFYGVARNIVHIQELRQSRRGIEQGALKDGNELRCGPRKRDILAGIVSSVFRKEK